MSLPATAAAVSLCISGLSKTYPNGVRALDKVSLDIGTGMFGLLGPNGAGKSTLMRTIATLQEADEGTIRFGELDVLKDKERVREILGYLPQEFGLYPRLTAFEMLDHLAVMKGLSARGERRELVDAMLRQTNLWDVRKQRLGTFSGGMKQRFGIAQALLGDPKLLIVDEPTAGLDPTERNRFLNLLGSIGQQVVVILSTHIVEDVRELCTRMAIIDRGRVLTDGSPQAAIDRLAGRVWKRAVDEADVEAYRARHQVISTHLVAGRTEIRVRADTPPGNGFATAEPDLRDVYFLALRREAE
jgi:ABC-type multidrug transport system ATPase subunit